MSTEAAAVAASPGYLARASAAVRGSPTLALGIIVALTIVAIFLIVYYRGIWFVGPFAAPARGRAGKKGRRAAAADPADELEANEQVDDLIARINGSSDEAIADDAEPIDD